MRFGRRPRCLVFKVVKNYSEQEYIKKYYEIKKNQALAQPICMEYSKNYFTLLTYFLLYSRQIDCASARIFGFYNISFKIPAQNGF